MTGVVRLMILGIVTSPASPATASANGLRELMLDVESAGRWAEWSILLAGPEAAAEAADLVHGDAIAFIGFANQPRFPGDPLARRLTAIRALSQCDRRPHTSTGKIALGAVLDNFAELAQSFENVALKFVEIGIAAERMRIASILNSDAAAGQLALAWRLAEGGLTPAAAHEALVVSKLGSIHAAVDRGATLTH